MFFKSINLRAGDIFKSLVIVLMSLVVYIAGDISNRQQDIICRLRIVELNQAKILGQLGSEPVTMDDYFKRYPYVKPP